LRKLLQQGFHHFQSARHALCGMSPTPHVKIPMMPNNISELKRTKKGCLTYSICWFGLKVHPALISFSFSLDQRLSSHFAFALHASCSKYEHS
jgi:hypothetical protein